MQGNVIEFTLLKHNWQQGNKRHSVALGNDNYNFRFCENLLCLALGTKPKKKKKKIDKD